MLSIITLTSDNITSMLANVGTLFTDLWLLIAVAIGIPLAFYVIRRAIALDEAAPRGPESQRHDARG